MDAHGVLDGALRDLGGEQLGHAGLDVGAPAGLLLARRGDDQVLGGLDARRHVGELELDRLVVADRLAEGDALLGVLQGQLEGPHGRAEAAGRDVDAAGLDAGHHLVEALVDAGLAAEHRRGRTRWPSKTSSVDSTPL